LKVFRLKTSDGWSSAHQVLTSGKVISSSSAEKKQGIATNRFFSSVSMDWPIFARQPSKRCYIFFLFCWGNASSSMEAWL